MALNHSIGFPNWRILTEDRKLRINFEPGSKFSYSGEGVSLLQKAVEETIGQGLDELSQKMVFGPLGMKQTSYVWQEKFEENHAVPHDRYERPKKLSRQVTADAAGSMQTTAADYARFLLAIHNAKNERKSSMDRMLDDTIAIRSEGMSGFEPWKDTDVNDPINLSWGLGWGRFDTDRGRAFFHAGHGFRSQNYTVTFLDWGISLVMLSNSDNFESGARELAEKTIGDVYSPFDWLGYKFYDPLRATEPPPDPATIDLSLEILEKYVGEYSFSGGRLSVKIKEDRLYASDGDGTWIELFAESESIFFLKGIDARLTFIENEHGVVTGFTGHYEGIELRGKRQ